MVQLSSVICLLSITSLACAQLIRVPRMIDGEPTDIRNFPYQISLQWNGVRNNCGGGIIDKRFILTSAFCVFDENVNLRSSRMVVVAGTTDLEYPKNDQSVEVELIYIPRSFGTSATANNIAVLKLKQDLDFSRGLNKLELPKDDQDYVGQVAEVAGYGWHQMSSRNYLIRYSNATIISNGECRQQCSKFQHNGRYQITDSIICAQALPRHAERQADLGTGDSGSPLVIGNTVIGVASQSGLSSCKGERTAGRYTRVSSFVTLVNNVLNGLPTVGIKTYNMTSGAEVQYDMDYSEDKM